MKNIEKSDKERRAIHDLDKFLATNYNTERLPARAYSEGQSTPKPLTVSQLVDLAFNAIPNDNINALRALVENYNLVNAKDKLGNSLLAHAVMLKKNDIVMLLIHHGADVNAANIYGTTPLIQAVQGRNLEQVRMLLKYGCNVRQLDNTSRSALDYASGDPQMRLLLTSAGAQ
jgi:ankyrin repeat protein